MDFKFSKDSGGTQQEGNGEKKKQSTLLVLLLILVCGFTYLYFFTGLIKPQDTQKIAEAPVAAPLAQKMPLPPREGEAVKPDVTAPEKAELPKTADKSPVAAATPEARPAVAPPAKAASATSPVPSKPKNEAKTPELAKPADKKPQPSPVADVKGGKASAIKAEEKKPAAEAKKPQAAKKIRAKAAKKTASVDQVKPKTDVKAQKTATRPWSLEVGNYVLEEVLSADIGRVRKAGFEPIVKPSIRKKTKMNRLFVSDFKDRETAQSTLEKLKRHTSDAFVMEQDGRYAVYAGSYIQGVSASSEKERLKAAGFSTTIRHFDIEIPTQSLTIGPLSSKKAADTALAKLKSAGIKASLSQK